MGIADRGEDSGGLAGRRNCGPRSALALGSKGGISLRPGNRMERRAWLPRCTSSSIRSRNTIRVRGVDRHRLSSCFPLYQGGFIIKRDDNACCFQGKPDGRTLGRVWTATVERRGLKPLLPALEPEFVPPQPHRVPQVDNMVQLIVLSALLAATGYVPSMHPGQLTPRARIT